MYVWELFEMAPDFGYKHFIDKDEEISKLKWEIHDEGKDGFIIKAVKSHYAPNLPSNMYGNYEGILIARPTDYTVVWDNGSFTQTGNNIQVTWVGISKRTKDYWVSTGLGQMLYDKAIVYAKKAGYDNFISDTTLTLNSLMNSAALEE